MKTIIICFLLFLSNLVYAQENDTVIYRYGLLIDYNYAIVNAAGFKYRQSNNLSYFVRGNVSSETRTISDIYSDKVNKINVYTGFLGIEYNIYTIDNISMFAVGAGGISLHTENGPYYANNNILVPAGNRKDRDIIVYSFQTGLGVEYNISNHLSISGSQSITIDHSKDDQLGDSDNSHPRSITLTTIRFVYAKITLSFYL